MLTDVFFYGLVSMPGKIYVQTNYKSELKDFSNFNLRETMFHIYNELSYKYPQHQWFGMWNSSVWEM